MSINRVLLVCSGNTCRSPMAATLLPELWRKASPGWDLQVSSAGTSTMPGLPASEHAAAAMRNRKLSLSAHRSRSINEQVLSDVDLVLTMTARHKEFILALYPGMTGRVYTLGEYAGLAGDVPDPFGGTLAEYEETARRLERLLDAVVARIKREGRSSGMKVAIGSDHGGLDLKEAVIATLKALNLAYEDLGTYDRNSCDYPDFAEKVGNAVAGGEFQQGILICGTGIGMSIAANKIPGVRAALCNEIFSAKMARAHNNANVLCLGARVVGPGVAQEIVTAYFTSGFEGGRHARRVEKLGELDARK